MDGKAVMHAAMLKVWKGVDVCRQPLQRSATKQVWKDQFSSDSGFSFRCDFSYQYTYLTYLI